MNTNNSDQQGGSVLHSPLFCIQHCSAFNGVLHSTLFCIIQQCSTFSRTIEDDVVLVMVVMVFCFNYSVDNYNNDSYLFTS